MKVPCLLVLLVISITLAEVQDDTWMHPIPIRIKNADRNARDDIEIDKASYWNVRGQGTLKEKLERTLNTNVAKNVIFFLGDGLSIPTMKAARIYDGQMHDGNGEDWELSFEKFPYVGLSKTYCTDAQVPDSACTATAYLSGIKARTGTIGVTGAVYMRNCTASLEKENQVSSIARWSQLEKKKTGVVTTTRITHASPAGVYANVAHRDWESDANGVPTDCTDIAYQLIHEETGRNLNVIMGGGRKNFLSSNYIDEEGSRGTRLDGRNLIQEWLDAKGGLPAQYIWNRTDLLNLDLNNTEYLLGLFESEHMQYHLEAGEEEPTLEEMTEAAIKLLDNEQGYFLFVEGGRIDHAHHDNRAQKALDETVEFSKAIQKARDITNEDDTLIVVTADHAHVMVYNGYADIGEDVLGVGGVGSDRYPYLILGYGNGPGYKAEVDGHRYDPSDDDTHGINYRFPSLAPLSSETHGGDDVGIFAIGPWSHLFSGVVEQNTLPHFMAYASCVGDGISACKDFGNQIKASIPIYLASVFVILKWYFS